TLMRIIEEIERNLEKPNFTVNDMAKVANTSQRNLLRKVKAQTGLNLIELKTMVKIKHAMELLQRTDMTIAEIAFTIGYNDPLHFSKIFKRVVGMPPANYRKACKESKKT
ncbi:MAG TPA: AraC family transcriptional regulator, partial [Bacteroidales bacterium]|nr:AraC family transcriptional regulator [Bacteroidales bacterium]